MKKLATFGTLLLFVVPLIAGLANAQGTDTTPAISESSAGIAPGISFTMASGATLHYATASDIELMKEAVGVRDPEQDYNVIQGEFGTGLAPPTEEAWDSMVGNTLILESLPQGVTAPASYDLSTQPYFPAVGNQGGQGSCGAWAATYYCYGYTEAKDQGWTDAKTGNIAHLISPAWTYNRVNEGVDSGSWMSENMDVIVDWGVPSMQTMPYNDHDLLSWGSAAAFREAPLHRALSTVSISYSGDATINLIKDLVSSDTPVAFAFNVYHAFNPGLTDNNIVSAAEYTGGELNHAQTIVGYNDSISEDGDVGAFRVVNSWGTSDGYTDQGYYWFTYNALKEIGDAAGLCYIEDRADYNPRLLAVWHFNAQPSRNNGFTLGIGSPSAPVGERSPFFYGDSNSAHRQPAFMCLDITDFASIYDLGTTSFFLKYLATSVSGVISSFRVEMYEPSYVSGAATQISPQSSDVPRTTPNTVTVNFLYHTQIGYDEGLDSSGNTYTSTSLSKWVGINHQSTYGGDALQSGDTANSGESSISTTVAGPSAVGFYWRVSSEAIKDYLNVYIDGIKKASISGSVDWSQQAFALTAGAHTIRWSYAKDSANSVGEDAGYVDRLRMLPPDDGYEENDVYSTSKTLSPGTYPGLVCNDDDWFKVHIVPSQVIYANITFVAGDGNLDLFLYNTDGTTLLDSSQGTSGFETVSSSVLVDGDYYILIRGVNGDTNTYSLSVQITTKIPDNTPPVTEVQLAGTAGNGGWFKSSITATLTASDVGNGVQYTKYQIDSGGWQTYSMPFVISAEGTSLIHFYSVDNDGNTEATKEREVKIDSSCPTTLMTIYGGKGLADWYVTDVEVNLTASDAPSGVASINCSMDGGPWELYSSNLLISEEGEHTVEWYAVDVAGNAEDAGNLSFGIDLVAPQSTATATGDGQGGWFNQTVNVTLQSTDAQSGVNFTLYRIDNGSWLTYSLPLDVNGDGGHEVEFYAVDMAGNSAPHLNLTFWIDATPPTLNLELLGSIGDQGWMISSASFAMSAGDLGSGLAHSFVSIDNGTWFEYSEALTVSSDGPHSIHCYAVDVAGNPSSIEEMDFKIDTQAPTSSALASGSDGLAGWYVSAVVLQLQSADLTSGLVNIAYSLDGGAPANYSQPLTVASQGEHTMNYYAQDQAGNVETTRFISFRIDTGKPQSSNTLTGPMGSEQWYLGEVSINLTASDSVSGVLQLDYRVDGGEWLAFHDVVGVASEGDHELEYRALDIAGNVEMTNALSFRIDSSAPSLELSAGNAKHSTSGSLRVVWTSADQVSSLLQVEVSVDGKLYAVVAPIEDSLEIKNLGDGKHTISLHSTDIAGNSVNVSYDVTVDTNPLSPSGPLGPWLLVTLGALAVAAVGLVLWRRRK